MWPSTANARRAAGHRGQGRQRRAERLGVGVVGVVDDRHPVRPRWSPPSATGSGPRPRTARPPRRRRPCRAGRPAPRRPARCSRCARRAAAAGPGPSPPRCRRVKPGRPASSTDDVGGADVRAAATGRRSPPGPPCRPAMASTRGSSAFSTATPSAGSAAGSSPLARRHVVDAAELAGVRVPDAQHGAQPRRRDLAQRGDVPGPARGHLGHQVPGLARSTRSTVSGWPISLL